MESDALDTGSLRKRFLRHEGRRRRTRTRRSALKARYLRTVPRHGGNNAAFPDTRGHGHARGRVQMVRACSSATTTIRLTRTI
jgi:hypothetical protein